MKSRSTISKWAHLGALPLGSLLVWATLCLSAADAQSPGAQPPRTAVPPRTAPRANRTFGGGFNSQWKFDTLRLKDGRTFHGMLRSKGESEMIDFVHVALPPGKPYYLVIISVDPHSVAGIDLLNGPDRKLLEERIGPLLTTKSKARIEAGRMENVDLQQVERDGVRHFVFEQPWFTLESTADEESTRRCAFRIEQVFRVFRMRLPPRIKPRASLRILLLGSMDEYRRHLKARGLPIDNPAYYSAADNQIVAGSELVRYSKRLAEIRRANDELRKRYQEANRQFYRRMANLKTEMKGFTAAEVETEKRRRTAAWDREYKEMVGDGRSGRLAEIDRRNEARFQDVTNRMFRCLYHEAFHAYLENHVFPAGQYEVPRWLNEGLAQIFEKGQLEADMLRIDAPDRATLLALQSDLKGAEPLSLAEVLTADQRAFMVTHGEAQASQRYYLYSWGLAWYIAFETGQLASERLAAYVSSDGLPRSPLERFEKLVGMPLPEYEQQWRTAMLTMPVPVP